MAKLPQSPSLNELQTYMARTCQERGWHDTPLLETFLLFAEEVGELAKAIRQLRGLYEEEGTSTPNRELAHELADVLSYLLEMANKLDINLEEAFREKEALNAGRTWKNPKD